MKRFLPIRQSASTATQTETGFSMGVWRVFVVTPDMQLAGSIVTPKQIHGGNIVTTRELNRTAIAADGVFINEAGVMAGVTTADCAPVVVVSDDKAMVLHVSRKSLIHGLLDNVATFMAPSDIDHIYVGPHICEYHFSFEEESDRLRLFRNRYPNAVHFHKGLLFLSLKKALEQHFAVWRLHTSKITYDGRCTFERDDLPSYRSWQAGGAVGKLPQLKTVIWRQE